MEAFLLENLPILLCFLFGVILLIVEVFMPGFGLPGISGIVLEGAAIVLTYLWHGGLAALGVTVLILAIVAVAISLALRSANRGRLSKSNIILKEEETAENGYTATSAADMQVFVGRQGVTTTPLRPTGLAEFDGVRLNVASQGDFIPKDTPVIVDHVEGAAVVVRRRPLQ
jgi:membrane-bound ClpP family serine protease